MLLAAAVLAGLRWALAKALGSSRTARGLQEANGELAEAVAGVGRMVNELRLAKERRTK